jgi:predicted permease
MILATSAHTLWGVSLGIGLAAALVVVLLLLMLLRAVREIDTSAEKLLAVAGQVAGNTAYIPQLQATAPVLAQIVDEAVVQDGYMNALTDGYGGASA